MKFLAPAGQLCLRTPLIKLCKTLSILLLVISSLHIHTRAHPMIYDVIWLKMGKFIFFSPKRHPTVKSNLELSTQLYTSPSLNVCISEERKSEACEYY